MYGSLKVHLIGAFFGSLSFLSATAVLSSELRHDTLSAWEKYVQLTEHRIAVELTSEERFLVQDFLPASQTAECRGTIARGEIFIERLKTLDEEGKDIKIPKGLVHHWFGSVLVANARLDDVLAFMQSYPDHDHHYDEVEESRLLSQNGGVYEVFYRLRRKKGITVHYNTTHVVTYRPPGDDRASSQSVATRIAEIEHPGTRMEREKPPGGDRGFLWRLNSYWRFKQTPAGVVVECESISLSRTVPFALRWMVQPFIISVPKESLEATLSSMRSAVSKASVTATGH